MKKLLIAATLTAWSVAPVLAQEFFPPYLGPDVVVYGNQIVGQDPDPNVRLDLRRNAECYIHSCGD